MPSTPRTTAGVTGLGSSNVSAINKPSVPAQHKANPVAGRTPEPKNTTIKKGNLYYTYNSQGKNTMIQNGKGEATGTADTPGFNFGRGTE